MKLVKAFGNWVEGCVSSGAQSIVKVIFLVLFNYKKFGLNRLNNSIRKKFD